MLHRQFNPEQPLHVHCPIGGVAAGCWLITALVPAVCWGCGCSVIVGWMSAMEIVHT